MSIPAELLIELDPPPGMRPAAAAIIEGVEEGIQGQVLTLASGDADYDEDFVGWLENQGLLGADGLEADPGESVMSDQYGENQDEIDSRVETMRNQNDSVSLSVDSAFATTNQTFLDIMAKVEPLKAELAEAPGPEDPEAGKHYMPIGAEYALIGRALNTLVDVIGLVDTAQRDMESYAEEVERNNPGNSGNPAEIWGNPSPGRDVEFTVTGDATVQAILDAAQEELDRGVAEHGGSSNSLYYLDGSGEPVYNIDDAWCASFATHVWEKAGYEVDWTNKNYVPSIWTDAKSMDLARPTGDAQPGDLIIFDWQGDGTPDHIGIVEEVVGDTIHTIEGNSGNALTGKNEYKMGNADVVGVVKPPSSEPVPQPPPAVPV